MSQIPIKELIPHEELMASGHLACPGCGGSLAMRLVLKTLGPKTIVSLPACCWTIVAGPYPQSSLGVPLADINQQTAALASFTQNSVYPLNQLRQFQQMATGLQSQASSGAAIRSPLAFGISCCIRPFRSISATTRRYFARSWPSTPPACAAMGAA